MDNPNTDSFYDPSPVRQVLDRVTEAEIERWSFPTPPSRRGQLSGQQADPSEVEMAKRDTVGWALSRY